jgi:FixJ family two-component response regulator
MKLGVIDFLWKPFTQLQMVQAIDKGLALDAQRHADQLRLQRVASLYEGLSPREQSMFALMLLGHGNKDIAASTGVMADTVKKHRAQVLTKMQVNSLADLLAFCKDFAPPATRA